MRKLLWACLATGLCANAAIISFNSNGPGPNQGSANGVWATGFSSGNTVLSGGQTDIHYNLIYLPTGCSGAPNGQCQEDNGGSDFGPSSYVVLGGSGTPPGSGYPLQSGAWNLANDAASGGAGSSWIGPRARQNNPAVGGTYSTVTSDGVNIFASDTDFYVYRMVFNLTALGLNPATANIQLAWLSDNNANAPGGGLSSHIRMCSVGSIVSPVCSAGSMVASSGNNGQGAGSLSSVSITSGFTSGLVALDFVVYNAVVNAPDLNPSGMRVDIISATAEEAVPEPATVALMGAGLALICLMRRKG